MTSQAFLQPSAVTLAVVAGGRAARLGGAVKGLLEVGGERAVDRVLRLGEVAGELILNVNDASQFPHLSCRRVADVVVDRGAPGGVVSCLLAATTPWVLAVAADMPFVTVEAARALLSRTTGADVVAFERAGRPEPLFALYRAALGAPWREALHTQPSLLQLLRSARLVTLAPADPHVLDSLNTPDDLVRHGVRR